MDFFFNFGIIFRINYNFFLNNSGVGFMHVLHFSIVIISLYIIYIRMYILNC